MHTLYGTLRAGLTPEAIAWYLLAFFAYLGMILWAERRMVAMRWVWAAAIVFRLLLLFTTPTLSDDVYRYLWDGHVANQGVSPYAYAINDPALDDLEVPIRDLTNNAWMASPYLPAAQIVFAGLTRLFPLRPLVMQAAMVIFDLGSAWLLSRLLALVLLPPQRLLIYLWNPLVVVETAHGAHLDAWMIFLALTAVALTLVQRTQWPAVGQWLAPVFLALATLTKPLPALLFPVLFWHWNWWQRLLYPCIMLLLLLPAGQQAGWGFMGTLDGRGLFGALRIYGAQWRFNSGLFHWLDMSLKHLGVPQAEAVAKVAVSALLLLLLLVVWLLARRRRVPLAALRLMSIPFMGYVLLTPTLHPWYMLILLAFVAFLSPLPGEVRGKWHWLLLAPWIYLSGALIFSYLAYLDPDNFRELAWVRRLEWLPVLGLLAITGVLAVWQRYTVPKRAGSSA